MAHFEKFTGGICVGFHRKAGGSPLEFQWNLAIFPVKLGGIPVISRFSGFRVSGSRFQVLGYLF